MNHYIFAYGSLMCPESCARTLNRRVSYKLVSAVGFERKYNAVGSVYHEDSGQNVAVRFANLVFNPQSTCLGLVFEITPCEIQKLQARESLYDLVDITNKVSGLSDNIEVGQKVFTFIRKENLMENCFVLKTYVYIMMMAAKAFPELMTQIESEYLSLKNQEILEGAFLSVSGAYPKLG